MRAAQSLTVCQLDGLQPSSASICGPMYVNRIVSQSMRHAIALVDSSNVRYTAMALANDMFPTITA
jgi:hypothetical protein